MSDEGLPDSDRLEGAPHPRETERLFGQGDAEAVLLEAIGSGRLHHAWLLTGPKGVGKATLAWRAARYLLANPPDGEASLFGAAAPPETFEVPADHPVTHRVRAGSDPGLLSVRRPWDTDRKRFKAQITVDEVRRLSSFFGLSATDGGYRIVIVDSADEMNTAAANALLKVLEEPPRNAVLFLVSHHPARLLPTIRSRCRELRLLPLNPGDLSEAVRQAGGTVEKSATLAELSGGSVGEALRLAELDGARLYAEIVDILGTVPRLDRQRAAHLADRAAQRGAEERLDLTLKLIDTALARLALHGAGSGRSTAAEGETDVFARLSPDLAAARRWAELNRDLSERLTHGRAVNIDPSSLVLDAFLRINEAAGQS